MIRYFFDTEFTTDNNGFRHLLSAAMLRDDGDLLYLTLPDSHIGAIRNNYGIDPWVEENVLPLLYRSPPITDALVAPYKMWGTLISEFVYRDDEVPQIFADWMSDIADLNEMFITGPGKGVPMSHQTHFCCLRHLDVYPTSLEGAVQHNAAWDVLALKRWLDETEAK